MKKLVDPAKALVDQVRTGIRKRIVASPDKKFLVVYVVACHGMQVAGRQVALINGLDKLSSFF